MDILKKPWVSGAIAGLIGGAFSTLVLRFMGQTEAHELIRALSQLLWPVVVLIVAFWFREDLRNVLARLRKGKFPGGEIEFDSSSKEPPPEEKHRGRTAMEYKILKTLWTKQVNRFPKYEGVWTFRINSVTPEFLEFREAANKLIGEGFVSETDQGQLFLTKTGFQYCKDHYSEFPEDEWWPEEKLKEGQLEKALESE